MTFENLFSYSTTQWTLVLHILSLGAAAHVAGLVYFLLTVRNVAPRYRLSAVLSAVVMVSAAIELYLLQDNWRNAFVYENGRFVLGQLEVFSNGFRYVNWSIDVPTLLIQVMVVLDISRRQAIRTGVQFAVFGLLMIYTGYVGQFSEVTDTTQLWVWGIISTVFYVYLLYLFLKVTNPAKGYMPASAWSLMRLTQGLVLVAWSIYPIAYLMPVIWDDAWGVALRQIIYTVADISSKIVYGVVLGQIALIRSRADGYEPSLATTTEPSDNPDQLRQTVA